jgi:Brp/Blh family beta-carotene 15,15'-monooxygenase
VDGNNIRTRFLLFGMVLLVIFPLFKLEDSTQLLVFSIVLLLTGVPHGALDLYLEEQQIVSQEKFFSKTTFFVRYFLIMLLYSIFWYFFPVFSLLLFILITAVHFGQIDAAILPKYLQPVSFIYGLMIILFIITAHISQNVDTIAYLLPSFKDKIELVSWGEKLFLGVFISILLLLSALVISIRKSPNKAIGFFVIQTILLLTIVYFLPFYLGFAFYFGIWHSLLSFELIINKLALKKNKNPWKSLLLKALPFSVLAWAGLGIGIFWGKEYFTTPELIGRLFVGIAILTLPHLEVFSKVVNSQTRS